MLYWNQLSDRLPDSAHFKITLSAFRTRFHALIISLINTNDRFQDVSLKCIYSEKSLQIVWFCYREFGLTKPYWALGVFKRVNVSLITVASTMESPNKSKTPKWFTNIGTQPSRLHPALFFGSVLACSQFAIDIATDGRATKHVFSCGSPATKSVQSARKISSPPELRIVSQEKSSGVEIARKTEKSCPARTRRRLIIQ